MHIIIFSRYTDAQASTRVRFKQFLPSFLQSKFKVEIYPIISDDSIMGKGGLFKSLKLRTKSLSKVLTKLWRAKEIKNIHIHIELFPWLPFFFEKLIIKYLFNKEYSLELDDAWFHRYDQHSYILVRKILGNKIQKLMKNANFVIAGNKYIADTAKKSGAKNIYIIPTTVDFNKYTTTDKNNKTTNKPLKIIWIGSPATTHFLLDINDAIKKISQEKLADFIAIGADAKQLRNLPIDVIPWTIDSEVNLLRSADIGIMPLKNSPFEQGKCGYKLIQYMACQLPVVASPVGVNNDIVIHNVTGYLANTEQDWYNYLKKLCVDPNLRNNLGEAGFKHGLDNYSVESVSTKLIDIFKKHLVTE